MGSTKEHYLYCVWFFAFFALNYAEWNYPGLHYDELFYLAPALGKAELCCSLRKLPGTSLLLFQQNYMGALKAYFTMPWFAAFSSTGSLSLFALRGFSFFCFSGALLLGAEILRRIASLRVAVFFLLFMLANPSIRWMARIDMAENSLSLLFFSLLLFSVVIRSWKLAAVSVAVGIFHRLNFAWGAGALCFALTFSVREWRKPALFLGALVILEVLAIFWFNGISAGHEVKIRSLALVNLVGADLLLSLAAQDFLAFAFGSLSDSSSPYEINFLVPTIFLLSIFGCCLWALKKDSSDLGHWGKILLRMLLFQVFCFVLSSRSLHYWHFALFVVNFFFFVALCLPKAGFLRFALPIFVLGMLGVSEFHYQKAKRELPLRHEYSTAIYPARDFCATRSCVAGDWGLFTQLLSARPAINPIEAVNPQVFDSLIAANPKSHFLFYANAILTIGGRQRFFEEAAARLGYQVIPTEKFQDSFGNTVIEAFTLQPSGNGRR